MMKELKTARSDEFYQMEKKVYSDVPSPQPISHLAFVRGKN